MGRPFAEAIKIGEMVENGLKTGRIVSQAALKATTQAIQNGSGGLANRKKRDEGSMMASGSREVQRGASHPYVQVQQGKSSYPQHYYPPPIPQYSVGPPQYTVFNAQSYARPPNQQVRAPAPRAPRPQQQNFRALYNARPRQDYGREQRPAEKFTPLAESYSSLFQKLKQMGVIGPIAPHHMHPDSHGFQANARCEYHSGAPGHSTDDCWTLKRAIERLISEKLIVVTNGEDPPNVTNNPLPAHNDVHFVGMIGRDQEYKPVGRAEMTVGAIQEGAGLEVSPSRDVPLIVKGAQNSNKATLFVPKISRLEVHSSVPSPRLYVLGGHPVKREKQGGTKGITEPIVIKPAMQLPVTNTKTTPWNYNKTEMTYKGKEIIEEVGEIGGFTRSGRCYSPEELRKAKQIREGHLPIKKPVTEADAEEFLKKMKVQDYSIIDQLRKTPTQISLLSLLLHSKEHGRVLIKVLNEAHISEETTVNQLEKMANRFFEVNRISFTDDELPEEGARHNRALNLMVKCEGHYVKRVMVDGGSSVDVCPLSTLQSMKIDTDRIRPNNVRIRAFDGSARDTIGEINLTMTIGPVDFEIVFQVVDMATSYNFLLGRPWIHTARAVPSTLHQMLKFEHDRQEIIIHGEDESSIYKDPLIPCIEAKEGSESIVYQAFEVVAVDHVEEGKPILHPRLSATSVMVAAVMMRQGYKLGKGLGASLQGISEPISPFGNQGTFGLGFRPTQADENKAKHRKKHGWVLQQPIPHIFYTFVKPRLREGQNSSAHANIDEICHGLSEMFSEVNMIQAGGQTIAKKLLTGSKIICQNPLYWSRLNQTLADHLAENPVDNEYLPLSTYFPDEEVNSIEEVVLDDHPVWKMYFDGAVNIKGVGIGAILISPIGHHYPATARL
ncbi:PREDICTED: uncharacterized protein LOC109231596 [Nicotiana attenuata]|uniref:uncharacterized protein LOC109231596 n=1 Tax=Nicotiana attenuata TaxID=49451 RepID=UPI000905959F|nr:PREDICTED: uncharacterized protein LOC109231596 [Nicotiana attenuata]